MKFSEAMNELAAASGIGPITVDGTEGATLLFDGEHEVTFAPETDGGVVLQCEIGDADVLGDGACRALLEASYSETGGAAFAIHRALGKVIIWKRCGEFESCSAIEKAVNDFLGQVVSWKKKLADGGIDMHYNMDKPIKGVDDGTTDGDGYPVGAGSKFMCKMDYTLKGDEFNRLAKLDYGKFDDSEGYKIFNRKVDMPDGTRQFREKKLEKVVDSFAQEFKVNADCNMDFALVLYPAENE